MPGALALKTIAQKFGCSIDWILLGVEKDMQQQKSEAISDLDLKDMIAILRNEKSRDKRMRKNLLKRNSRFFL